MLCPKCGNNYSGNECPYCRSALDDETKVIPVQNIGASHYEKSNFQNRGEAYNGGMARQDGNTYSYGNNENSYSDYSAENQGYESGKAKLVSVISVITALLILAGIFLFKFVFSVQKKDAVPQKDVVEVKPDSVSRIETLAQKAKSCMDMGDYEEAEELCFELADLSKDAKVQVLYKILYNYNRAVEKLDEGDYKNADKFYERIPEEYVDYNIAMDVDDLYETVKEARKASLTLDEIEACIEDKDCDGAKKLIDTVDKKYLSTVEKQWLEDLTAEVAELEEKIKNGEDKKVSGYGYLSEEDAEIIIYTYCTNLISAINNCDFNIVAPYIYSQSSLYSQQKSLVETCRNQGITQYLESLTLKALNRVDENKWEAMVTEQETIFYADGTDMFKTFNWTYTIEYISGQFFMTGIK